MTGEKIQPYAATAMIISCEHGGNRIPDPYRLLFRSCRERLDSHRGFDPGALLVATDLARHFAAPLLASTVSRLLVDLNRSIGHPNLHMDTVRSLPDTVRQDIIERYYLPYRAEGELLVTEGIRRCGKVIHISCHSFTDNLNGLIRDADVGLLYDSTRPREKSLCTRWKAELETSEPGLRVRRNFPYKGNGDGFTSTLRRMFPADAYLGIELELNQKNFLLPATKQAALRLSIITSLQTALREPQPCTRATR